MKTTYYADSIGVVAIITLIVASILTPALLFTQTAIASIDDEQSGNTITNDTEMTPQAATASDSATTQRVAVGGGNITFSVNQFIPQITEIQPGENVTFFAPDGSIELHNVIFDLSNGTIISEKWLPFTLPSDFLGGEVLQMSPKNYY
jgi:hypothetical protein